MGLCGRAATPQSRGASAGATCPVPNRVTWLCQCQSLSLPFCSPYGFALWSIPLFLLLFIPLKTFCAPRPQANLQGYSVGSLEQEGFGTRALSTSTSPSAQGPMAVGVPSYWGLPTPLLTGSLLGCWFAGIIQPTRTLVSKGYLKPSLQELLQVVCWGGRNRQHGTARLPQQALKTPQSCDTISLLIQNFATCY